MSGQTLYGYYVNICQALDYIGRWESERHHGLTRSINQLLPVQTGDCQQEPNSMCAGLWGLAARDVVFAVHLKLTEPLPRAKDHAKSFFLY